MNETWKEIMRWCQLYFANGNLFGLYIVALVVVFLARLRKKKGASMLCVVSIFSCGIIFCPPIALVLQKIALQDVYWRMFWLMLIPLVITLAVVELLDGIKQKSGKVLLCGVVIAGMSFCGRKIYTKDNFSYNENWYKIPQNVIEVNNVLCTTGEKEIKIIAPDDVMIWIRTYNSNIKVLYGRDYIYHFIDGPDEIYNAVNAEIWNVPFMVESAVFNDCNFIVQPLGKAAADEFEYYGFEEIGHTAEYVIYKDTIER